MVGAESYTPSEPVRPARRIRAATPADEPALTEEPLRPSHRAAATVDPTVNALDEAVVQAGDGHLVGLDGRFQFDEPSTPTVTGTALPSGHRSYSVWYFVTGRFALRGAESNDPLDERSVPRALEGRVVACSSG